MRTLFKIFYVFNCFLITSIILHAQSEKIQFEYISTEQGLSNNFVYCTIQDEDGFIWFGSEDGLNRWDGNNIKIFKNDPDDPFSISNNQILSMLIDKKGFLWVSTGSGLNKYNKTTEKFESFKFIDQELSLPHASAIGPVLEDSLDILWVGSKIGLVRFDTKTNEFLRYIPNSKNLDYSIAGINTIIWLYKFNSKRIVIGTADGLIHFSIANKQFERITPSTNHKKNKLLRPVADAIHPYVDSQGKIWVQTLEGGLYNYNPLTNSFNRNKIFLSIPEITEFDQIWSITKDKKNNIWFTTIGKGIFCYNLKTNIYTQYLPEIEKKTSISSRWFTHIYIDRDGIIWASTFDKGINALRNIDKNVTVYKYNSNLKKSPPAGAIMDICQDNNGMLWIASIPGGAAKFNIKNEEFIHIPFMQNNSNSTLDRRITALLLGSDGNMWLGAQGLDKYDHNKGTFTHFVHDPEDSNSISNNYIISMIEDRNGYIWCGMRGSGVERFDPKTKKFKNYRHLPNNKNSMCNDIVRSILEDHQGNLWFGTENGLSKLENKYSENFRFINYQYQKNNNSISGNFIYSVFEDSKKRLWIGTTRGLNQFNRETEIFSYFNQIEALSNNMIYSILEDDKSNLWIRSNIGLIRFNPKTSKTRVFTEQDGLENCRSIVYGYNGFTMDNRGYIFYGSPQSLLVFHPDSLKVNSNSPKIVLTDFKLNNKPVEISENSYLKKSINYTDEIKLPHNENTFSFDFVALDYTAPGKNKYAYKMEGFDKDWIYTDAHNRVGSYTNIAPGEYVFRVKGSNNDGVWNEEGASVIVMILPPWWATWWFRLIAGVLILSVIIALHKKRVRYLKNERKKQEQFSKKLIQSQEEERKRIAGELHDGLGQNLMIIYNRIQYLFKDKKNIPTELEPLIPEVKETIEEVREIARNLHPHQLEQLGLTKAIQSIMRKLSRSTDIKFNTKIDFIDSSLLKENWIHVYRIVQEALTNIIKHSSATEVKIEIFKRQEKIHLLIADNGVGLETISVKSVSGFGLENLRERARLLNAKLEISSPGKKGVTIFLEIPIN